LEFLPGIEGNFLKPIKANVAGKAVDGVRQLANFVGG
jgi:hypothetical protein